MADYLFWRDVDGVSEDGPDDALVAAGRRQRPRVAVVDGPRADRQQRRQAERRQIHARTCVDTSQ